uniref:Uncharacterized protein n=1 Tax=Onchocerca volvulus TaxID=6282 RepID=A0A8R1Y3K4_ONCVO
MQQHHGSSSTIQSDGTIATIRQFTSIEMKVAFVKEDKKAIDKQYFSPLLFQPRNKLLIKAIMFNLQKTDLRINVEIEEDGGGTSIAAADCINSNYKVSEFSRFRKIQSKKKKDIRIIIICLEFNHSFKK